MKIKCDNCIHNVLSDESSVGCGFVPYCNMEHWGGFCAEDYDESDEYCTFRDNCKDYKSKIFNS